MSIIRSYVIPFLILIVFLIAMLAVSARIWLPSDMLAPAPIDGDELAMITKVFLMNGFGV
ncbi:hypothetical protein N836_23940 [Leptolyngbya sp. Heron Island J]|uniref:hypothetical protein n=1 Tax=Leptolyngbya sp. Heron Island J TaxID=1385935 RepID=UPI0003B9E8FA|nr:hypothetical protein [Leptolyngbya sp. Heron Island J]ESA33117.1 hypothetical protein N836_23940 [Leptolyngbya sp. Heron Island J]